MRFSPGCSALAALGLLASCGTFQPPRPMPVNWYLAAPADVAPVRRVMLLPFRASHGVVAERERIRTAFLGELNKLQRFEVVPLPAGAAEQAGIYRAMERGRVSTNELVALAKRYRLDGVILGEITSYRAYLPPHLGLRVKLFSVHSGNWIWAAEGHYDANDARTIEDLEHFQQSFLAEEGSLHGMRINLLSPTKFCAYVSHRLVRTWRRARG